MNKCVPNRTKNPPQPQLAMGSSTGLRSHYACSKLSVSYQNTARYTQIAIRSIYQLRTKKASGINKVSLSNKLETICEKAYASPKGLRIISL
ncbi:hypothetical protein RRG08_026071 [Elysia crispata]|uniref:Uncharacterized protein n=1 Tax=Elysia crispata TaxID=231223 RepID=A0AAE0YSI1_9GAST|nr:hypothetical protein RRG08_026071 [Elysia crispata]